MRNRHPRIPGTGAWRATILLAGVGLLLSACNGGANLEMPEGAQALPDEHVAVQLILDNASDEQVWKTVSNAQKTPEGAFCTRRARL